MDDDQIRGRANITPAEMNLIFRARMIWRDLATWLRAYMISLYGNIGNVDAINQRLYKIPVQYGNIFRLFFGDQITEQLIFFVTQYIALYQSLFIALLNNDVESVNKYTQQLYQNIEARAGLFSTVNPYWNENEIASLITSFTNMNVEAAKSLLRGEYNKSIDVFDRLLSYTTVMGDFLSEGLLNYLLYTQQPQQTNPDTAT